MAGSRFKSSIRRGQKKPVTRRLALYIIASQSQGGAPGGSIHLLEHHVTVPMLQIHANSLIFVTFNDPRKCSQSLLIHLLNESAYLCNEIEILHPGAFVVVKLQANPTSRQ